RGQCGAVGDAAGTAEERGAVGARDRARVLGSPLELVGGEGAAEPTVAVGERGKGEPRERSGVVHGEGHALTAVRVDDVRGIADQSETGGAVALRVLRREEVDVRAAAEVEGEVCERRAAAREPLAQLVRGRGPPARELAAADECDDAAAARRRGRKDEDAAVAVDGGKAGLRRE